LALAGFEDGVRQKRLQGLHVGFALGREPTGGADQFEQVLDPPLATITLLLLEVFDESAVLNDVVHLLVEFQAGDLFTQLLNQL